MAGEPLAEPVPSLSETEELLLDGSRYGDAEDVQAALEQRVNINIFDASGRTGAKLCALILCVMHALGISFCAHPVQLNTCPVQSKGGITDVKLINSRHCVMQRCIWLRQMDT